MIAERDYRADQSRTRYPEIELSLRSHEALAAPANHNAEANFETNQVLYRKSYTACPQGPSSAAVSVQCGEVTHNSSRQHVKEAPQSHARAPIFFYTKRAEEAKALQRFFRLLSCFAS